MLGLKIYLAIPKVFLINHHIDSSEKIAFSGRVSLLILWFTQ